MATKQLKVRIKSDLGWLNGAGQAGGKTTFLWTQDKAGSWGMSPSNAEHQLTLVRVLHPEAEIVG